METIRLHNGVQMPAIGLGTYPIMGEELRRVIDSAYRSGYRLIDTADNYYNERDLGDALSRIYAKGARRDELFLVSKISDELYHPNELGGGTNKGLYFWSNSPRMQGTNSIHDIVRMKIEGSLRNLRIDYLDCLLITTFPTCETIQ